MFSIHINTDGMDEKFDTITENLEDLEQPLRKFGAYLRGKA